jgi:hypothetical protein
MPTAVLATITTLQVIDFREDRETVFVQIKIFGY